MNCHSFGMSPKNNWGINDLEAVCARIGGLTLSPPTRGTHYKLSHSDVADILTIPANRPIKPVYIKRFVSMLDSIIEG